MPDFLRPILARLIGSVVGGIAAWVYGRWGYTIDAESQAAIISTMLTIFGIVYACVHRAVSIHTNPVDAASPSIATDTKKISNNEPITSVGE